MQLDRPIYAITFPIFENVSNETEHEIVQIFLQRFRDIRFLCNEERVTSAIIKTANLTGNSISFISKTLVINGLKAKRHCFLDDFLMHVDQSLGKTYEDLKNFWVENNTGYLPDIDAHNAIPPSLAV